MGASNYPMLFKVAEIVFKVPKSQAAAERACSIYDFILTKRRNRHGPEKVTQLVQLYMNADLKEHKAVNGIRTIGYFRSETTLILIFRSDFRNDIIINFRSEP
jgi:hypothetical protein